MECCCASCLEVSFADFFSFSGGMYSVGVCGDSVITTNLYTVTYAAGFISGPLPNIALTWDSGIVTLVALLR